MDIDKKTVLLVDDNVDLIILDLAIPIINGETLVDILNKNPKWKTIPVLIISGFNIADRQWPMNVKGVLGKPVPHEELMFDVEKVLL